MADAAEPGTIFATENTFRLTEGYFSFDSPGKREKST